MEKNNIIVGEKRVAHASSTDEEPSGRMSTIWIIGAVAAMRARIAMAATGSVMVRKIFR